LQAPALTVQLQECIDQLAGAAARKRFADAVRLRADQLRVDHDLADTNASRKRATRSEEHTSELQSQSNLVCRLLLEKKKSRCLARGAAALASAGRRNGCARCRRGSSPPGSLCRSGAGPASRSSRRDSAFRSATLRTG